VLETNVTPLIPGARGKRGKNHSGTYIPSAAIK